MIKNIVFWHFAKLTTILNLLSGRVLFASLALFILTSLIMKTRKNLIPTVRSLLWGLCLPALFIPFERSFIIITQNLNIFPFMKDGTIVDIPLFSWIFYLWSLIWLLVFIFSTIKMHKAHKYTLYLLKSEKITSCATYFFRGRSHIYLPPNFEKIYTSAEQEMLLAHEKQHIKQNDPLLYRFLQIVKCIFWFCPFIHKSVHLIRQDRELLCDERAVHRYSKQEYGMLLLREAQKETSNRAVAGIISESSGVFERVYACISPFSGNTKIAIIVVFIAVIMFAGGFIGIVNPVVKAPMNIRVFLLDDDSFSHIEGTEKFVLLKQNGFSIAQKELYEYAISLGLKPEQYLSVSIMTGERPTIIGYFTVIVGNRFKIGDLKSNTLFFPYNDKGFNLWNLLYKGL